MSPIEPIDVPSPIDLKDMGDALEWERTAMLRPFREEFFEAFYRQLLAIEKPNLQVLELGSGPGFLAHYILTRAPGINYTLLDFSTAMHTLAKRRLASVERANTQYLECDFKDPNWTQNLGKVDAIVTNQAVHELRHKRYAADFFLQLSALLKPNGVLLYCDHYFGHDGSSNDQLYMSLEEQRTVLLSVGFEASEILVKGGRALYRVTLSSLANKET